MRNIAFALLALCLLCTAPKTSVAQSDALTKAEKTWLSDLSAAKWSTTSGNDDVKISARSGPMMDNLLLSVLPKWENLNKTQRATLLEGVRIDVKSPGWLKSFDVEPGRYTIGFRSGPNNLQTVIRDPKGNTVHVGGMGITSGTSMKPVTSCYFKHNSAQLEAKWGNIAFSWWYVSKQTHDSALGVTTERKAGNVSVFSDLPDEAGIQQIAELCKKAVAANETLMGVKAPKDFRYRVYLLRTLTTYKEIDQVLTGGNFAKNGAFTSALTRGAYVWHYTHWGEDYELPSSLLEVVIHELHHQYVHYALPSLDLAATWFKEACAEVAAQQGLELCDKTAAENYRNRRLNELKFSQRNALMPGAEDVLTGSPTANMSARYTVYWCIGQALAAQPADLHAIVKLAIEHQMYRQQRAVIRREFDQRYPTINQVLDAKNAEASKASQGWIKSNCCVDLRDDVLEFNSEAGVGGYALINAPADSNDITLDGEFRWDDDSSPQVDFIFAYGAGSASKHFLKLALLRAKATLFEFKQGKWTTLGTQKLENTLDVMTEKGEPVWHEFKLSYNAASSKVELILDGQDALTEFSLPEYKSAKGTYTGVGVYDGVIWFRKLKLS